MVAASDHDAAVAQVAEIANIPADRARQLLEVCDYDVERAVTLHLANNDEAAAQPSSSAIPVAASSSSGHNRSDYTPTRRVVAPTRPSSDPSLTTPLLGATEDEPAGGRGPQQQRPWWRSVLSAVASLFAKCFGFFGACFKGLWSFFTSGLAGTTVYNFNQWLEKGGDTRPHPRFFEGTFSQALSTAERSTKFLFVYLHNSGPHYSEGTNKFKSDILQGDSTIRELLDENFVLWGVDCGTAQGYSLAYRVMRARSFPYLCALMPKAAGGSTTGPQTAVEPDSELRVSGVLQGDSACSVEQVTGLLLKCVEDQNEMRSRVEAVRLQQQMDRELRQQQDQEYQEALAQDREAERNRKEAEERAQREAKEEMDRTQKIQRRRQNARRRVEAMAQPAAGQSAAHIVLKMPSGKRFDRKFLADATVADLYDWADVCVDDSTQGKENEEEEEDSLGYFELSTAFPVTKLRGKRDRTLKDMGLAPNAVVMIAPIDPEEDPQFDEAH
ncbi:hypothetical protein FOZ63_033406 [Perkinsus olseni]|uniref:UBX domain-containing protein n=2 Tax=Perkinsus olseni TaxID=32597 RepID=A0A7J6RWX5_PEROL|nr:hypothetical protein FOZ63_033406 [Perkinsus olseni]